jgi:hypothetical protein
MRERIADRLYSFVIRAMPIRSFYLFAAIRCMPKNINFYKLFSKINNSNRICSFDTAIVGNIFA